MKRVSFVVGAVMAMAGLAAAAPAQPAQARVPAPRVSSSTDRTAIWIGDRVVFTVEIACAPGVDILLDDVAKEKLRLNGLDVVSSDTSVTTDASDRTTHRLRYVLTTYHVDNPLPSIEPMSVRYYERRQGERLQDVAPAGDVQVPGAVLAFRSTLPENQPDVAVRAGRAAQTRSLVFARASQIGLALIVISVVPAIAMGATTVRRRTAGKPARTSARQAKQDQRATLERLRSLEVATDADRRRACEEVSAAVRGYVASRTQLAAMAMTAAELDTALAARGGRIPRETVIPLLTACDQARYRPADAAMPADACREAIATAAQVLEGR